jgi:hypothetical protein
MNPWLRVAAAVVGAFVCALFLKLLPPVIVLAAFVVGAFVITRSLKTRIRREAVVGQAATLGLRLEASDPFGLLGYPLSLFGRGRDGHIGEVRWGTWRGNEVKAFDFTFAPAPPATQRSTRTEARARLSCAIAAVPRGIPPFVAEPVSIVLRLGTHAPMAEVSDAGGSGAGAFVVRCDDPTFARTLLAGPVVDWLRDGGEEWGFELSGPILLIYGAPAHVPSMPEVLGRLDDLRARISTERAEAEPDQRAAGAG